MQCANCGLQVIGDQYGNPTKVRFGPGGTDDAFPVHEDCDGYRDVLATVERAVERFIEEIDKYGYQKTGHVMTAPNFVRWMQGRFDLSQQKNHRCISEECFDAPERVSERRS